MFGSFPDARRHHARLIDVKQRGVCGGEFPSASLNCKRFQYRVNCHTSTAHCARKGRNTKAFHFTTTPVISFGAGNLNKLADIAHTQLREQTLIVTDPGMMKTGLVDRAVRGLTDAGIECHIFDGVQADPTTANVLEATELARRFNVTAVIGIGGGSSLDVAKLVAVLAKGEEQLDDLYGINQIKGQRLPLVLIPTTAGTGSEVTPISIVTTETHEKKGVVSPVLLPDMALLDPETTLTLPAHITAATGIDAMVHAIESYTSTNANNNPMSQGLATRALELLAPNLRTAVAQPDNLAARSAMLLGSMLAGQAFANSPVAAVHALAYPLGGQFGISHGLSNALMLPHVMRFNASACTERYAELAGYIDPDITAGSAAARSEALINSICQLIEDIALPARLRDVEIPASACPELAQDAMNQTRLLVNNPRPVDHDDALALYKAAW